MKKSNGVKKKYFITGMHCPSCRAIIEEDLVSLKGVTIVSFPQTGNTITLSHSIPLHKINEALKDQGYALSEKQEKKSTWLNIVLVLLAIYFGYTLLKTFDIPLIGFNSTETLSVTTAIIFGLIASVSTCFAVAGGLLLGIIKDFDRPKAVAFGSAFSLGRVLGYAILGGLLGVVGSVLSLSTVTQTIILFVVSIVLILLGLQMSGVISFGYGTKFAGYLAEQQSKSSAAAMIIGAATFFLPCGFTQALQLYVLQQGDFWTGFIILGGFALGTIPALMLINFVPTLISPKVRHVVLWIVGIFLILMGIFGTLGALPAVTSTASATVNEVPTAVASGDVQVVSMKVVGYDYEPSQMKVEVGKTVRWEIDASRAAGCARVLTVPTLGINKVLDSYGLNIIEFTPTKAGTISFTCSMGMTGPGKFIVE